MTESTTLRRPDENRAAHRARLSRERRAARKRIDDLRERIEDDLTTITLHPTKGFRRVSGKRVEAQAKLPRFILQWSKIGAAVR